MFKQVELAYSYDALEPYIDALTMETHYSKHHAAYTKALNEAVEKLGYEDKCVCEILRNLDDIEDEALRRTVRNNGGGFYNHNLYFSIMSPNPNKNPEGKLLEAIEAEFGSVETLKDALTKLATGQFGSGWAWLCADENGKLVALNSPNQDNPFSMGLKLKPILGIDVWEHAYYLKYKNLRGDYVKNFFEVLDWDKVAERYEKALSCER